MALKERKIWPKWHGKAKAGTLVFNDPEAVQKHLLVMDDKELDITIKPHTKMRSRQEEKFYHAVVVRMVAEAMDILDQEAHEFLKNSFLRLEAITSTGVRYHRVLSTTELSSGAYRDYWETCIKWAALPTLPQGLSINSGLALVIPYPNEVDYQDW